MPQGTPGRVQEVQGPQQGPPPGKVAQEDQEQEKERQQAEPVLGQKPG